MLASHNDGAVLDDVRRKLAGMFVCPGRDKVTGKGTSKKEREEFHRNAS